MQYFQLRLKNYLSSVRCNYFFETRDHTTHTCTLSYLLKMALPTSHATDHVMSFIQHVNSFVTPIALAHKSTCSPQINTAVNACCYMTATTCNMCLFKHMSNRKLEHVCDGCWGRPNKL